jgi:hypothetical protein
VRLTRDSDGSELNNRFAKIVGVGQAPEQVINGSSHSYCLLDGYLEDNYCDLDRTPARDVAVIFVRNGSSPRPGRRLRLPFGPYQAEVAVEDPCASRNASFALRVAAKKVEERKQEAFGAAAIAQRCVRSCTKEEGLRQ